jgi:hypothetical protein
MTIICITEVSDLSLPGVRNCVVGRKASYSTFVKRDSIRKRKEGIVEFCMHLEAILTLQLPRDQQRLAVVLIPTDGK